MNLSTEPEPPTLDDTEPSAIRVDHLSIAYSSGGAMVDVLNDVSVQVRPGEVLGLVGESGSGKSTIAGALLGALRAGSVLTAGQVHVAGSDVFALAPEALRQMRATKVSLVPQNAGAALTPTLRIGALLKEALTGTLTPSATRARSIELLRTVRLPDPAGALERYPHQFSGGQQQRIAIAIALAATPAVLVLDEPTTGLDVVTQMAVLELLLDVKAALGTTMVVVSHDLGVIDMMCDHVAVLSHGSVVESGPVQRVLGSPSSAYTRALIASVPRINEPGIPPAIDEVRPGMAFDSVSTERVLRAPRHDAPLVLRVRDVKIDYRRKPVPGTGPTVDGVSFDIHAGEIVALVGESGSGKSTIANAVAGMQRTESGALELYGPDGAAQPLAPVVTRRPRHIRQAIQLVFQNADTALNPRKTVRAAVQRPIDLFRVQKVTVPAALTDVELAPSMADRLPAQLSGGQRQRVGIARAVAVTPELVLADEIVSALDVSVQSSILRLVDRLTREKGVGVLFITHDLAVVRSIADRVVVLYLGRVVEEGTTDEVLSPPSHPYTRLLLASVIELGDDHAARPARVSDEVPAAPPERGCPFASRCPLVRDACRTTAPPALRLSATHQIYCHADLAELGAVPSAA